MIAVRQGAGGMSMTTATSFGMKMICTLNACFVSQCIHGRRGENDLYTTSRGSNSSSSSVAAAVEQLFFRVKDMRACHGQRLVIMLSFFV